MKFIDFSLFFLGDRVGSAKLALILGLSKGIAYRCNLSVATATLPPFRCHGPVAEDSFSHWQSLDHDPYLSC